MRYFQEFIFYATLVVFIVLAIQSLYLFLFALAGKIVPLKKHPSAKQLGKFVIYIPSYKEDAVIVDTAMAAVAISYPDEKKHVVVIADSLQPSTLVALRLLPIQVVEVSFEKSTKAKALNRALEETEGEYDYALVLDADNVCATDFLYQINNVLQAGFQVVQGQRVAKNTNTPFAVLDAISEGINNHILRKGHRAIGLSAAIIGSGMAFRYSLFRRIMPEVTAVGGFDKELELRLLRQRIPFGYAEKAIVYDEKVTQQTTFENQRRRWLSAQLVYMKRYLGDGFVQLFHGNVDYFNKAFQTVLLPRILMLGFTTLVALLSLLPGYALPPIYWFVVCGVTYLALLLSVPSKYVNRQLFKALVMLPVAFLSMAKLLFKLKGANTTFIHTPHGDINTQKG